jgi:PPE-repeat protein
MTVPPAEVAANRTQLTALVATNFIGQNTPAIAATEAQYGEMWAQDAAAMYGYAASSASAAVLKPFSQPAQVTSLTAPADQAAAVLQSTGTTAASATQATLAQVTTALPAALQSLASPLTALQASALWPFLDSNFVNGFVSAGYTSPALLQQTVTASMADLNAVAIGSQPPATPSLPPMGSGSGNEGWAPLGNPVVPYTAAVAPLGSIGNSGVTVGGVSAGMARGALVGQLSVPQSWTAVTQVANHSGTALPGGGWTGTALPETSSGVPGMPGIPAVSTAAHHFGSGPRYGFRPTVMARPPAAG